eukprot:Rhum_TRINITY_DN16500_c0_g1::Rhum_TRINITY_DN16500_c0_g1_i1::g.163407::m.163407
MGNNCSTKEEEKKKKKANPYNLTGTASFFCEKGRRRHPHPRPFSTAHHSSSLERVQLGQELNVVRRAETRGGVPTGRRGPRVLVAALGAALGDVVERGLVVRVRLVQRRREEAEGRLARLQTCVEEETHDAGEDRARARRTSNRHGAAAGVDRHVAAGRHVRVRASGAVPVRLRRQVGRLQELRHGGRLPGGARERVGEAAAGEAGGAGAGRAVLGAADGGDVRQGGGEVGDEAVVLAAGAVVAGGSEEGEAAGGGLLQLDVSPVDVRLRQRVLALAVRDRDERRHGGVGRHVREELHPRLLVVHLVLVLVVPHPRGHAVRHGEEVLRVQVCLNAAARHGVSNLLRDLLPVLRGAVRGDEVRQVARAVLLSDELREGHGCVGAARRLHTLDVVRLAQLRHVARGTEGCRREQLRLRLRQQREVHEPTDEVDQRRHGGRQRVALAARADDARRGGLRAGPLAEVGAEEGGRRGGAGLGHQEVAAPLQLDVAEAGLLQGAAHGGGVRRRHTHPVDELRERHVLAVAGAVRVADGSDGVRQPRLRRLRVLQGEGELQLLAGRHLAAPAPALRRADGLVRHRGCGAGRREKRGREGAHDTHCRAVVLVRAVGNEVQIL